MTLPKAVVDSVGPAEYFDVDVRQGQIVLTPVRIQRGDAVRAKLVELGLVPTDIDGAVHSARSTPEPSAQYGVEKPRPRRAATKPRPSG